MNWKTFFALLSRDGHVARRNLLPMLMQNLLQPLLLTFVFGRVLTTSGMMQMTYKNVLLPGIIAISMVLSGVQAVAMPLIAEFQFTREIEDRLLAPMENDWLAVEKIVAGMIQALVSGLVVIPAAWLVMGSGRESELRPSRWSSLAVCLLVALLSGAGRTDAGMQHRADADRPDVQPGGRAHDDVRLRVLPVERAARLSRAAIRRADQSAGVCQRRPARRAGSADPAHPDPGDRIGALAVMDAAVPVRRA